MTTRKKESVSSVREKGGTSPSSSNLKSSPKPSKTVSTSKSLDSSPSEKTIPNYLKPTLSSSLSSLSAADTSKLQGRRAVSNTDSALKNLARRRSFDKPPSPTRSTRTRGISPTPTFRSSSFSGKTGASRATTTTTSPRGDRTGKQPSLYARAVGTLKKSTSAIGKSNKAETGNGTASSRKGSKHDNQNSPMGEAEEQQMAIHDTSDGKEHEDSPVADQGEIDEDHEVVEAENHKADSDADADADANANAAKVESPTIMEERDASIEKAESPKICEENDENDSKVESPTLLGQTDADDDEADVDADAAKVESPVKLEEGDPDSVKVDSPTVSEEHQDGDKSCTEETSIEQQEMKEETANNPPDQSAAAGNPNEEAKEAMEEAKTEVESGGEGREGVVTEEEDTAPKVAQAHAHAHGKKDVALSNNVIEEMTREQRRNKVRALAGAFETVISLQDHK